jgi:hypothetical protein
MLALSMRRYGELVLDSWREMGTLVYYGIGHSCGICWSLLHAMVMEFSCLAIMCYYLLWSFTCAFTFA